MQYPENASVYSTSADCSLFSFWDSLIVASAILGEASILYSEDMQVGLIIENALQIVNPFLQGNA